MKRKFIQSLGILTGGALSVATVISCSEDIKTKTHNIKQGNRRMYTKDKEIAIIDLKAKTLGASYEDPSASQIMAGKFIEKDNLHIDLKKYSYGWDTNDNSGKKYDSFIKQLKKMYEGETKIITIFLPTNWSNSAIAGRKVFIKVKLHKFDFKRVQLKHPITLSYEGRSGAPKWKDAIPFNGGTSKSSDLDMSGHSFIGTNIDQNGIQRKGFEEQLIGMKAGEEKIIDVAFPKGYQEPKLAGQHAFFKVKILKIK